MAAWSKGLGKCFSFNVNKLEHFANNSIKVTIIIFWIVNLNGELSGYKNGRLDMVYILDATEK